MKGMGALEAAVMDRLWSSNAPMSVRDVFEAMSGERDIAYTTVLTVLDNLHKKDLVTRDKVGRAWQYSTRISRDDYTTGVLADAIADSPSRGSAILKFVETLTPAEIAELKAFLGHGFALMMALVLLLAYAAAASSLGGRALSAASWPQRSPRLGIFAWLCLASSVAIALFLAGFILVIPDFHLSEHLALTIHACVAEFRDRYSSPFGVALPVAGATLAALALVRLFAVGAIQHARAAIQRRSMRRDLAAVGSLSAGCTHSAPYVSLNQADAAIYCVPGGRKPTVVVTSGAQDLLTHDELAAALGHEQAHLRARHHWPILVANVLSVAFLQLGVFRTSAAQVALLAEMDADDGARHLPGLSGALARLALASPAPSMSLAVGGSSALQRLRRLALQPAPLNPLQRCSVGAAAAGLLVVPFLLAMIPAVQALLFDCCGATPNLF